VPVHRLKARKKEFGSENPSRKGDLHQVQVVGRKIFLRHDVANIVEQVSEARTLHGQATLQRAHAHAEFLREPARSGDSWVI
jgi:hypothetical protein